VLEADGGVVGGGGRAARGAVYKAVVVHAARESARRDRRREAAFARVARGQQVLDVRREDAVGGGKTAGAAGVHAFTAQHIRAVHGFKLGVQGRQGTQREVAAPIFIDVRQRHPIAGFEV